MKLTSSAQQLRRTLHQNGFRRALRAAIEKARLEAERESNRVRLTASEYFALRKQVRVDVEDYLLEHGEAGINAAIVDKWVGEATRHCLKNMVAGILDDPPSPQILATARARIEAKTGPTMRDEENRIRGTQQIAAQIPAAPSPSYIARNGVAQLQKLDIFVELNNLFADARLLREHAIRQDPDGRERVTNPRVFDRSISRRIEILSTMTATQKELWDLQRMEAFYTTIIDTIAEAAPEVAREIQRRLSELNINVGMT